MGDFDGGSEATRDACWSSMYARACRFLLRLIDALVEAQTTPTSKRRDVSRANPA